MKISAKISIEMMNEIVSMITKQEDVNQAKEYGNVVYITLTNPLKLYNSARGVREFSLIGFYDQEDEIIMVGNIDYNNKPYFEEAEYYCNGVLNVYAQLCGTVVCDTSKC